MITKEMFGIKRKEKNGKIKFYYLGIPVWKVVIKNTKIKIYFLGIRMLCFPKPISNNKIYITKSSSDYQELKAFEILNSRKNCFYE